jgi:ubiquinone/menaquinone biosynthesis C-methylase UbiE
MSDAQTNGKLFDPANRHKLFSPDRMKRFPPAAFLSALRPWQGIRYADLGAGTGYFTIPVLDAVAGVGRFTAVDLSPVMLEALREKLEAHPHGARVKLVRSFHGEVPLPAATVDAAALGNFLHELDAPTAYLIEVRAALVPGGRVFVADWDVPAGASSKAKPSVGPPYADRIPVAHVRELLRVAEYEDVQEHPGFRDGYLISGTVPGGKQ